VVRYGGVRVDGHIAPHRDIHRARPFSWLTAVPPDPAPELHFLPLFPASLASNRDENPTQEVDGLLVLMILAVGLSRILLGVHYPSDVAGGWAAGGAWMAVCVVGIGIAEQRRLDRARTP